MKVILAFILSLLLPPYIRVFAQPGLSEMEAARQNIKQSFYSSIDASLVLAAIFGIIGAVKVYNNWQFGKPHITTEVAVWFFASLFMVLMGPFIRTLFGL